MPKHHLPKIWKRAPTSKAASPNFHPCLHQQHVSVIPAVTAHRNNQGWDGTEKKAQESAEFLHFFDSKSQPI